MWQKWCCANQGFGFKKPWGFCFLLSEANRQGKTLNLDYQVEADHVQTEATWMRIKVAQLRTSTQASGANWHYFGSHSLSHATAGGITWTWDEHPRWAWKVQSPDPCIPALRNSIREWGLIYPLEQLEEQMSGRANVTEDSALGIVGVVLRSSP